MVVVAVVLLPRMCVRAAAVLRVALVPRARLRQSVLMWGADGRDGDADGIGGAVGTGGEFRAARAMAMSVAAASTAAVVLSVPLRLWVLEMAAVVHAMGCQYDGGRVAHTTDLGMGHRACHHSSGHSVRPGQGGGLRELAHPCLLAAHMWV